MTITNNEQAARAAIEIGLGHLRAALYLWSPGLGLSPRQERESAEVQSWKRYSDLLDKLEEFAKEGGPCG